MIPFEQRRIGKNGTCFVTALASILEAPELMDHEVHEDTADKFLAPYGYSYAERPYDQENPPVGWHLICGTSPRGGEHAVVGRNGTFVHDPHPVADDPRRGLVRPKRWGMLVPLKRGGGRRRGEARDSALSSVLSHHDAIKATKPRPQGEVQALVGAARELLASSRISDKAKWTEKLQKANVAARLGTPAGTEYALAAAHHVLDALKSLERRRGRMNDAKGGAKDAERYYRCPNCGAKAAVKSGKLFHCTSCRYDWRNEKEFPFTKKELAEHVRYANRRLKDAQATDSLGSSTFTALLAALVAWYVVDRKKRRENARVSVKDVWSDSIMPMNYGEAKRYAQKMAREERATAAKLSKMRGSLRPEFTAAMQACINAASQWEFIIQALSLRSDEGEETAEELWGSAVRLSREADLLTEKVTR